MLPKTCIAIGGLFAACVLTSCRMLEVKVWRTAAEHGQISALTDRAPEQATPLDGWSFDPDQDIGLAFSGGGTMAATCAAGQLRALRAAGLMPRVKYVSTVSGGTWGVLPYIFLNPVLAEKKLGERFDQDSVDERYLGGHKEPGSLSLDDFLRDPPRGSLAHMVAHTAFRLPVDLRGDENFAAQLNSSFLKPVGIGDQGRCFAWSREWFDRHIKPRNPSLRAGQFYFVQPGRPFLIANAALVRRQRASMLHKLAAMLDPRSLTNLNTAFWPMEITPLHTGMATVSPPANGKLVPERPQGGGFIETFGYNGRFVSWAADERAFVRTNRTLWPRERMAFSLADAMAASGAAPGALLGEISDIFGFQPEFWTWSPRLSGQRPPNGIFDVPVVDGGSCDNSGALQLIARGVTKIIVFLNSASLYPYDPDAAHCGDCTEHLSTMLTSLFGYDGEERWRNDYLANPCRNRTLGRNRDESLAALKRLDLAYRKCVEDKRPLIFTDSYITCENRTFGIPAGRKVAICWVYPGARWHSQLPRPDESAGDLFASPWIDRLPASNASQAAGPRQLFTNASLVARHRLKQFPAIPVFFPNPPHIQQLKNAQAASLAHYHCWNLKTALPGIQKALGL